MKLGGFSLGFGFAAIGSSLSATLPIRVTVHSFCCVSHLKMG